MNSIARVADVSPNTVAKLLMEAGRACEAFHDKGVRKFVPSAFSVMKFGASFHAKQKNVARKLHMNVQTAPVLLDCQFTFIECRYTTADDKRSLRPVTDPHGVTDPAPVLPVFP
jgi:hypothetical protein